jgi:hypothetical protein
MTTRSCPARSSPSRKARPADGAHGLLLLAQVEVAVLVRGQPCERVRLRAPVQEVRHGDRARPALRQRLVDGDEPVGVRVRERAQQHRVDDREDGRVAAYSEGECQHGDGREARLAPQHAERVPDVFDYQLKHVGASASPVRTGPRAREEAAERRTLGAAHLAFEQPPVVELRERVRARLPLGAAERERLFVGGFEVLGQLLDDLRLARAVEAERREPLADEPRPL